MLEQEPAGNPEINDYDPEKPGLKPLETVEPKANCPKCGVNVPSGHCLCASCLEEVMSKKEPELNLEEGSAKMTLQDIYAMFYILVRQNQKLHPGSTMSFDLRVFKTLPKKPQIWFERKDGRLFAWIPEKPKDRKKLTKSNLFLPDNRIITLN